MRKKIKTRFSPQALLEVFVALFILFAPSFSWGKGFGLYVLFALTAVVFAVGAFCGGKIYASLPALAAALATVYALFSCFWAEKLYSDIRFVFGALTLALAMCIFAEYVEIEKNKSIERRLRISIAASSFICAILSIAYFVFVLRFSLKEPLKFGFGDSGALSVFMLAGMGCFFSLYFERKRRKPLLLAAIIPLVAVLVLCRAAFFAAVFVTVSVWKRGGKRVGIPCAAAALAIGIFTALGTGFARAAVDIDALRTAFSSPCGLGGGGYYSVSGGTETELGLLAYTASSFGIVGLVLLSGVVGRELYLAIKHKSRFCACASVLGIYALFAPLESSPVALVLLGGAFVYGDASLGKTRKINIGLAKWPLCVLLGAALVYGCVLGTSDAFYQSALKQAERGNIEYAASLASNAAEVNPLNGDACALAAELQNELYKSDGRKNSIVAAEYYIKRAIGLEPNNAARYALYARIKAETGLTAAAVELGARAVELAPHRDDIKLAYAADLYALIQTVEKGSLEAENIYEKLLDCGNGAGDIDIKKQINDYADKAQPYTRVDIVYEE